MEDGDEISHRTVTGGETREAGRAIRCRTGESRREDSRPMPARAAFLSEDRIAVGCGCSLAHEYDLAILRCRPTPAELHTVEYPGVGSHVYAVAQVVTAVAADGGVAVTGKTDGRVTVWADDGPAGDGMRERFSTSVSDRPIRWLLPHLGTRTIVAIDDAGHVAALRWG